MYGQIQTPTYGSVQTETHTYDGELLDRLSDFKSYFEEASSKTLEDKSKMFDSIEKEIRLYERTEGKEAALHYMSRIKQDMLKPGRLPNYDSTNFVYADDILWLCGRILFRMPRKSDCKPDMSDVINELVENLADMRSGDCPQGRTTRLLQVLFSFEDVL